MGDRVPHTPTPAEEVWAHEGVSNELARMHQAVNAPSDLMFDRDPI